jgi:ketosteroid isomerase-like protein
VRVEEAEGFGVIDRLYGALGTFYAGGAEAPVRELLTEDVEWHVPGKSAIAGDYRGIDAVVEYLNNRRSLARGTYRMLLGEVLVGEEHVAVLTDGTAVVGGVEGRWTTLVLYHVRDGAVSGCWLLPLDGSAFDAIWSPDA